MNFLREMILKTAWWAPVAVLLLHKLVMRLGLRDRSDWLLHMTGGFAIALFIWTLIPLMGRWLGPVSVGWSSLLTFCGGCTVALMWDLTEFASDEALGTEIQHSLRETMQDLEYGVAGVTAMTLVLVMRYRASRKSL